MKTEREQIVDNLTDIREKMGVILSKYEKETDVIGYKSLENLSCASAYILMAISKIKEN